LNNDPDDFGESVPALVDRFVEDSEPFLSAESSRATAPGRVWCRCQDPAHRFHFKPQECGEFAFKDGVCRACCETPARFDLGRRLKRQREVPQATSGLGDQR